MYFKVTFDASYQGRLSSLVWYADCKRLALEMVVGFVPPADLRLMRLYHGLYLSNLSALVDRTADLYGKEETKNRWKSALDGLGGHTGENNEGYVRELRNAVVHRGLDLVASATVLDGQVCALSPREVHRQSGKGDAYLPFSPLLRNIFAACEDAIGPLVLDAASADFAAAEAATEQQLQEQFVGSIHESHELPDWVKGMAVTKVDMIPFEAFRCHQMDHLRKLLGRIEPSPQIDA